MKPVDLVRAMLADGELDNMPVKAQRALLALAERADDDGFGVISDDELIAAIYPPH